MPAYNEAMIGEQFKRISERFRAIEAQLARLSDQAGIPYENPADGVPADVLELAKAGKELEAVKRYREITGVDVAEAQSVIAGI